MRTPFFIILSIILSASPVHGDVHLQGDLIVTRTAMGARYMGEIVNDTDSTVTDVKVTVTVRNASSDVIDETDAYVDGYTDPASGSDASIPPGKAAPFIIYGEATALDNGYPDTGISYTVSKSLPDLQAITLDGEPNIVSGPAGTTFYGEIVNNTSTNLYYARVMFALKDSTGALTDIVSAFVEGKNYLDEGNIYTNTLIPPGVSVPFTMTTSLGRDAFQSYYPIITFTAGGAQSSAYFGEGDINISGGIDAWKVNDRVLYEGVIENGTDRDIYFVTVTLITRDAAGRIIDISRSDVDGTFYEVRDGYLTESHIAPGERASFDIDTPVPFADMASFEYLIHYRYSDHPAQAESDAPNAFVLNQNTPNPFNPVTSISFTLAVDSQVVLRIYNAGGQMIEEALRMNLAEGNHQVTWDGGKYTSGTYIYELSAAGQVMRRKMTLLK